MKHYFENKVKTKLENEINYWNIYKVHVKNFHIKPSNLKKMPT